MAESTKLQEKAEAYKAILIEYAEKKDPSAELLLDWLTPLFDEIAAGNVSHREYEFRNALGKESDFFLNHMDVKEAEVAFIMELEDWENQEWYKKNAPK